jgi:hypothetical protein
MESSELIGLVSAGANAALVAAIGGDASWNVAEDWGLGNQWKAVRVPAGIKFRRLRNGLVSEEILITRGSINQLATHAKLLALSRVPTHLVFVEQPQAPRPHRLSPHFRFPHVNSDS